MKTVLLLTSLAATPAAVAQAPAKFEITRSDTISFTLTVPGGYPFICTTPGHFSVMQGVITVRAK